MLQAPARGTVAASLFLLLGFQIACSRGEDAAVEQSPPAGVDAAAQEVLVELDAMEGLPFPPKEATVPKATGPIKVSLQDIYSPAGLKISIINDSSKLKSEPRLTQDDLHALLLNESIPSSDPAIWKLYGLIATSYEKPDTRGMILTLDSRRAFVIFYNEIKQWSSKRSSKFTSAEFLRVLTHEMSHCFNVHHPDYDGPSFRHSSTLESNSRAPSVRWHFSQKTINHFLAHHPSEIRPGGKPFAHILTSHGTAHKKTNEVFTTFNPDLPDDSQSILLAGNTLDLPPADFPLELRIKSLKPQYDFREPVILVAELVNKSDREVELPSPLDLEYRSLNVEIQRQGKAQWDSFIPVIMLEAGPIIIKPNQTLKANLKIFYGASGFTFHEPGSYQIRATFPDQDLTAAVEATAEIEVAPPDPSLEAAQRLISGKEQALYLLFGGGDHLQAGKRALEQLAQRFPDTPYAGSARIALGLGALEPTVNPITGVRPAARMKLAERYLLHPMNYDTPTELLVPAQADLGRALALRGDSEAVERVRKELLKRSTGNPEVINIIRAMEFLEQKNK